MNTRSTQATRAVTKLLQESSCALSHLDIQKKLGDLCNRVTIYRIMDRSEKRGKIHKIIDIENNRYKYNK